MGVWIETCGREFHIGRELVTPYVGVWIETCERWTLSKEEGVTPYVGVWIETVHCGRRAVLLESHPAWEYMDWSIVHSSVKFMEEL